MSVEYEEGAEGVLEDTVEVKVKYCVVVIVEVTVAYERTKNRGSKVREKRMVIINREKLEKKNGHDQRVSGTGFRSWTVNGKPAGGEQSGKKWVWRRVPFVGSWL